MFRRHLIPATIILLLSPNFNVPLPGYNLGSLDAKAQAPTTEQQRALLRANADKLFVQGDEILRQGQWQKALETFQQVLAIRSQLGDRSGAADTLIKIGDIYDRLSRVQMARNYYQQALEIYREIGDRNRQLNAQSKLNLLNSPPAIVPQTSDLNSNQSTPNFTNYNLNNANIIGNDNKNNFNQLPWILVSQNRNQIVPVPVTSKISDFFTSRALNPISCSTNPVTIMLVNNLYIACASPSPNFPAGTYNVTLPGL
ncbi:tetratricopeptide repeat protein [Aerosakkonema sp. BLCC-F183]|uniref:tetratricopeptide repeat protein n=1 Tax=Aerosakkonema sp. BLCC-F183 TaxID=3342834 RepID=UPI0035B7865C